MFQNNIAAFPELLLILCVLLMAFINKFRSENTPKTFFTISKIFLAFALLATVIFYNKSFEPSLFQNDPYTSMFKVIIYLFAIAWFYLSCKWFLNKNRSSFGFYSLLILSILALTLAISAVNLLALFICLESVFIINCFLIKMRDWEDDAYRATIRRYVLFGVMFGLFFALGIWILYSDVNSLNYADVYEFMSRKSNLNLRHYAAFSLIMISLFYMFGIAPFHFWFADVIGISVLPVCGYLTIIPVFAYFACTIDLIINAFFPVYFMFKPAVMIFAVLSMVIGVIGANSEQNMRKLFAYSTTYHLGIILLSLAAFNDNSVLSSFIYMLVYVLAMFGIYTSFYGLRSKGEYLINLESVSGVSGMRPYVAAAMLIFLISLISTPPMLGFLGKLSVINNLVIQGSYVLIFVILLLVLGLVYAYMRIIKSLYFDARVNIFDRVDKGVYICLFINLILVLISILNPKYLMHDVEAMLVTIF